MNVCIIQAVGQKNYSVVPTKGTKVNGKFVYESLFSGTVQECITWAADNFHTVDAIRNFNLELLLRIDFHIQKLGDYMTITINGIEVVISSQSDIDRIWEYYNS